MKIEIECDCINKTTCCENFIDHLKEGLLNNLVMHDQSQRHNPHEPGTQPNELLYCGWCKKSIHKFPPQNCTWRKYSECKAGCPDVE